MRDLFRDALDTTALVVEVGARFIADSITERRNAFSDDDAAAYLRCAGADALAETFAARTTGVAQCLEHDLPAAQCARMPHTEGDEWTPVATRLAAEPSPIPGDEGPSGTDSDIPPVAQPEGHPNLPPDLFAAFVPFLDFKSAADSFRAVADFIDPPQ